MLYTLDLTLRRNILIFHQGALGDFIVTWPLALGLGRAFAQSRVFYVTSGQKGALAEKALRVEWNDAEGGWHHLYSADPHLPDAAARLLAGAQCVIGFGEGAGSLWATNVKVAAPEAHLILLSTTPSPEFCGHVTEYLLEQLKQWPVVQASMGQMLRSVASRGTGYPRLPGGPVVMHPGAGSPAKCWPVDCFLELAQRLRGRGENVEVLLGEVELEKWPASRIEAFKEAGEVRTPGTLSELLDRLAGASAFVGNDSGPGHLAGILGVPTISIFGPRDPQRWKPLGPIVRAVTGEWDQITVDKIYRAVRAPGAENERAGG